VEVSDCEELVGVNHRRWWGWFFISTRIQPYHHCWNWIR